MLGGKAHHRNSKSTLAHSLNMCSLNTYYIPAKALHIRHAVVNMSARALPATPSLLCGVQLVPTDQIL